MKSHALVVGKVQYAMANRIQILRAGKHTARKWRVCSDAANKQGTEGKNESSLHHVIDG